MLQTNFVDKLCEDSLLLRFGDELSVATEGRKKVLFKCVNINPFVIHLFEVERKKKVFVKLKWFCVWLFLSLITNYNFDMKFQYSLSWLHKKVQKIVKITFVKYFSLIHQKLSLLAWMRIKILDQREFKVKWTCSNTSPQLHTLKFHLEHQSFEITKR